AKKQRREEPNVEILERGEIFFFYRPKVEREEAHGPQDVQRLYIVLQPESGERPIEQKQDTDSSQHGSSQEINIEKQMLLRFIVMGRKSLPDSSSKRGRPYWGFVEMVTTKSEDIKLALKGEEYDTATRGNRHKPPARALAEGIYRILRHNRGGKRMHTHLVYKLEYPPEDEKNEAQESLNIEREGSFLIQIKNPDQHGSEFRGLESKRKATFPAHLQGQFGNLRYHTADPPDFLNYEGCEFLLISASDDIEEELGLQLETEIDAQKQNQHDASCSDLVRTFGETASTRAFLKGTWV
ncbi:Hypothetical predicted protein, partial [Olea europaea subsp. europaea]